MRWIMETVETWNDAWALLNAPATPPTSAATGHPGELKRWPSAASAFAAAKLRALQSAAAAAQAGCPAPSPGQVASSDGSSVVVAMRRSAALPPSAAAAALGSATDELAASELRAEAASAAARARTPLSLALVERGDRVVPFYVDKNPGVSVGQQQCMLSVLLSSLRDHLWPSGGNSVHIAARGALVDVLRLLPKDALLLDEFKYLTDDRVRFLCILYLLPVRMTRADCGPLRTTAGAEIGRQPPRPPL